MTRAAAGPAAGALGVLFPPLAVLSSAHELFLRNQEDLGGTIAVLRPFWITAAAASLIALLLRRSEGSRLARAALSFYYGAGLAFVAWTFFRALPAGSHLLRWILDTAVGSASFGIAWFVLTIVAARRLGPRRVEPVLAVLAVLLLGREASSFATRLVPMPPPRPRDLTAEARGGTASLPNVYHVLLDALPEGVLDAALSPGAERSLEGFVRFRARSPRSSTHAVLPAILTGAWLEGDGEPRLREALLGDGSLFRTLRAAGWRTVGFVPRYLYGAHRDAFDVTVVHDETVEEPDLPALHAAVFLRLWVFGVLPRSAGERLAAGRLLGFETDFFRMAGVERLSTYAQPLISRLSFERLLALEPRLPARGRYTYVHLLLPHNPYVLRADCRRSRQGPTDLLQQTRCTLLLLQRFVETLRRLDRLDGSVVLVHGDHGSGQVLRDGRLVGDADAWLRTLVLVKPVGGHGRLRDAEETARVVDIAPTLLAALGIEGRSRFDGRVLSLADR